MTKKQLQHQILSELITMTKNRFMDGKAISRIPDDRDFTDGLFLVITLELVKGLSSYDETILHRNRAQFWIDGVVE